MAAATGNPIPYEPFGQIGVRQFVPQILLVVSSVVMAISAAFWVRSYYYSDTVVRSSGASSWIARSIVGRVTFQRRDVNTSILGQELDGGWNYEAWPVPSNVNDQWSEGILKFIGVEYRGEPIAGGRGIIGGWWLRVRWRTATILSALLPTAYFVSRLFKRKSRSPQTCVQCGYDLRATPDRCPECGTVQVEAPGRSNITSPATTTRFTA